LARPSKVIGEEKPEILPPKEAFMQTCAYCKVQETELYEHNIPICVTCAAIQEEKERSRNVHTVLVDALRTATQEANIANREFNAVISELPSALPHPDGTRQLANASFKVAVARSELTTSHNRLNDFLSRGIIPDDLK
jgi:hypothetical protein